MPKALDLWVLKPFGDPIGLETTWAYCGPSPNTIPKTRGATQQWVSTSSYETAPYEFASKTTTTYATQTLDNKVFINLPTTILYEDGLQGISSTETYTYDSYNNPLTTTTSFSGGTKPWLTSILTTPRETIKTTISGDPKKS